MVRFKLNIFIILLCTSLSFSGKLFSQVTYGKIVYERKTNLYKKLKGDSREWIKENNKTKIDLFELYFNDSLSAFLPQESELKEKMSWATNKNSVYQNFKTNRKLSIKKIWSESVYIADTLTKRTWKITDSHRNIGGFNCRKAIWQANDSTRIYAWYCNEIMLSSGPESFNGLPGMILGLATEDGGVIYFAKQIELTQQDIQKLIPQKTKSKIYSSSELKEKLQKEFGKDKYGKEMIHDTFDIW